MVLINKEVIQNTLQFITFKVVGDHSNRKVVLVMKETSDSSIVIVRKANLLGGGSNTQISSSYDGTNTTLTVRIENTDTGNLNIQYYYYSLNSTNNTDSTDSILLFQGYINLLPNVQRPTDLTWVQMNEYYDQGYDKLLILQVASGSGIVTKQKDLGFNSTYSGNRIGLGLYKITSTLPVFSTNLELSFSPSTGSLNISPVFTHNLGFSLTELQIGSYDIKTNSNIDIDFFFIAKKIR